MEADEIESGLTRINNEFALVELSVDRAANGPRLKVRSVRTHHVVYLDALQLEALTWLPLQAYLDALETPLGPDDHEDLTAYTPKET